MKIAEVLRAKSSPVATIHPDQLVGTAVQDMKVHAVGALLVTPDRAHVDGIVNERDVVRAELELESQIMRESSTGRLNR